MIMNLKAIAFDIDGTLYPNFNMYFRTLPYFIKRFALIYRFGKIRKKIRKETQIKDYYHFQAELMAKKLKMDVLECKKYIKKNIYEEWESKLKDLKLFPKVKTSLQILKDNGLKLFALSDFPVKTKMKTLNLEGYWDQVLSSEEVGYLKPNLKPFLALLENANMNAKDVLFVGNSYKYDILGARNAGMYTAHISRRKIKGSLADFTFYFYEDLVKWILSNKK